MSATLLQQWRDLVDTRWPITALQERLAGTWIAILTRGRGRDLVATCVLRPRSGAWLLETFVARPRGTGYGTLLARHAVPWVWSRGCRSLVYTWELGPLGLGVAWWRGWLRTAVAYEWGWVLRRENEEGCSFCPEARGVAAPSSFTLPVLIRSGGAYAVVSDSGLSDGWGYVLATAGPVNWPAVFQKGGWRALWYRGVGAPEGEGWRWTGEIIVVGVIGAGLSQQALSGLRLSPEIASG